VVKSFPELRTGKEKRSSSPRIARFAATPFSNRKMKPFGAVLNANCKAQVVERIIHFVSKDAMDIRSMGKPM
jgi:DNA ligase (NAD+)